MSIVKGKGRTECDNKDDAITDAPLTGSVGIGGLNKTADVHLVQQYLNSVLPADGGPDLVLAEDGIIGPKTKAAIAKFQTQVLHFHDGRVDVNGPTIKALTKHILEAPQVPMGKLGAPESPNSKTPGAGTPNVAPIPSTLGVEIVAMANMILRILEPRLQALRFQLTRVTPNMMALLNKHFANGKERVDTQDIRRVQKVLADIHFFVARFNAFGKQPSENVILFDPVPNPDFIGRTVRGGNKLGINKIQIYQDKKTGVVSKNPGQSIWLSRAFETTPSHEKHWTVLHEFAHFVGGRDGKPDRIDDIDKAYSNESKFQSISKFKRLHNAESISLFFLEFAVGTDAITVLPGLNLHKAHFEKFPKVTQTGEIVAR